MPPGQAGLASGIASATRQAGQALGVAIGGSLLTAWLARRGRSLGRVVLS